MVSSQMVVAALTQRPSDVGTVSSPLARTRIDRPWRCARPTIALSTTVAYEVYAFMAFVSMAFVYRFLFIAHSLQIKKLCLYVRFDPHEPVARSHGPLFGHPRQELRRAEVEISRGRRAFLRGFQHPPE